MKRKGFIAFFILASSFFLITYKYDKEHFRLEEFNKIEDHHFHITDFEAGIFRSPLIKRGIRGAMLAAEL